MIQDNGKKVTLWCLADRLRYHLFTPTIIQLLFLKAVSKGIIFEDNEKIDYRVINRLSNMFSKKIYDLETVEETYRMIRTAYNLNIQIEISAIRMKNTIFDGAERIERIYEEIDNVIYTYQDNYEEIINDIFEIGAQKDSVRGSMYITPREIVSISTGILDVKNEESFFDPFSGYGRVAFNINSKNTICYDVDSELCLINCLTSILLQKKNFNVDCKNFYDLKDDEKKYDKIYSDGPYGLMLSKEIIFRNNYKYSRSDYYNIIKAYKMLDEGGLLLAVTGPTTLASSASVYVKLREEIINEGVKAIISLPALWSFTSISGTILVLEKGYKGNILFINASNLGILEKPRRYALSNDDINKIVSTYKNNTAISGFSSIVSRKEVIEKGYDIRWNQYVDLERRESGNTKATTEEIKKKLDEQYEVLSNLIKDNLK